MAAEFENHYFAEGRFRYAYKGVYTAPPDKRGKECVVKKMKESYTWKPTDWDETLQILEKSKQLAVGFNKHSNTNRPVKFVDVVVSQVTGVGHSTKLRLQEYITVEDYIPGDYTKWCNNYGAIDPRSTSMPAFVHWSWAHTKGETMIADLQGIRTDDAFHLTDPCLLSGTHGGKYGCTDMGIEGMAMFFLSHTCNEFCKNIPKPSMANVPQHLLARAAMMKLSVGTSTAFSHEITFPKDVRDTLIPVFKQIAITATV